MKHCVKCEFFKDDFVQHPSGQLVKAYICSHKENTDPVTGDPVPCSIARREQIFCGHQARFFVPKKEQQPDEKEQSNVIQIPS